jgi:hypothetical protein
VALDRATGHQLDHGRVLCIAGAIAHVTKPKKTTAPAITRVYTERGRRRPRRRAGAGATVRVKVK